MNLSYLITTKVMRHRCGKATTMQELVLSKLIIKCFFNTSSANPLFKSGIIVKTSYILLLISYIFYCEIRWIERIVLNWCRYQSEQQMAIATSAGPSTVPLMPPGWLAWSKAGELFTCVVTSKYVLLVYIVAFCVVCEGLTWTCIRLWDCVLLSS